MSVDPHMEIVQLQVTEDERNQHHPKRIKTQQTEEEGTVDSEDRISSLSDCLIIEILIRLESTKDAIRTGTLSKRWLHLWTCVPNLIFSTRDIRSPRGDRASFFLFVDNTIYQYPHSKLNKFQLQLLDGYDNRFESYVNNWIRYAIINCNVRHLHLSLWNSGAGQFVFKHAFFFVSSHFTHLYLKGCVYHPPCPISWNKLKTLSITNGNLDEHLIANILSGSPLLDTLSLLCCHGYKRLDITSKSVKNLVFAGYNPFLDHLDDVIEINAPYISSLTIQDDLCLSKVLLLDVSSLIKANLDYRKCGHHEPEEEGEEMLKSLILNLCHVKELQVGITCYSVLSHLEAKGFIFPSNLKVLDVPSPLYSDSD